MSDEAPYRRSSCACTCAPTAASPGRATKKLCQYCARDLAQAVLACHPTGSDRPLGAKAGTDVRPAPGRTPARASYAAAPVPRGRLAEAAAPVSGSTRRGCGLRPRLRCRWTRQAISTGRAGSRPRHRRHDHDPCHRLPTVAASQRRKDPILECGWVLPGVTSTGFASRTPTRERSCTCARGPVWRRLAAKIAGKVTQ